MPVQFICPHCTQLLSVGSRKIGMPVACPRCQNSVTVPDREAAAVSVAMRESQRAPPPESALPEFMVFDDPPPAAESFPMIVTDDLPQHPRERPHREPTILRSRHTFFLQAFILAAATLAAFGLGYLTGRSAAPVPVAGAAAPSKATTVQGQVRYTSDAGEVRGDAGAVIIALPEGQLPTPKLGVQGLRPADEAPLPGKGVLLALELLGGATTRVAEDGSFNLTAPKPGRYFLLFISRNAQRPAGSQPDEFQLALLQRYFQPADELIGSQKYLWRVEDLLAGSTERSHEFGVTGAE